MASLRIADPGDIDAVAGTVADAFQRLEVIHYLVPDDDRRRQVSRDWYRLYIAHAVNGAGQVVMTPDAGAVAVWFDRTGDVTEPDDYPKHLADLAGQYLPRFEHLDHQMDAHHPRDPHWHLLFLAVHPDKQNQGLGSRLMDHTHRELDARGTPAYLEATSEQNRRLYHRHGYLDMTPPTLDVCDGTVLYRMWRPVQNG
jgi:ribosomal protein S18 acetylase RimI-like enzyme